MIYVIDFTETAQRDITKLKRSEPKAYSKLKKLFVELQEHPEAGTGRPKLLGEDRSGQWSRRITQKHRLIYVIDKERLIILILSCYGHYEDK